MTWTLSPYVGDTFGNFWPLLLTSSACVKSSCLFTISTNRRYRKWRYAFVEMNTLAVFWPLSLTNLTCVNLHRDLWHYFKRALLPTCEHYNVNKHPCNPSGYFWWLSTTIIDYFCLRQSSKTLTITSNARYRQLVNIVMLTNTLSILRGTFGNFRPLSLTTSTCVNLHRDLQHYLERALSPTWEHYNVNEHPRNPSGYFSVTFDRYHWLLWLASIFIETYSITWNARYRQLENTIMLMNTLAILRGTFR